MVFTDSLLDAQRKRSIIEKNLPSLLVVSSDKALMKLPLVFVRQIGNEAKQYTGRDGPV